MKKFLFSVLSCLILLISDAQVPDQVNYQGIARNSVGNVLPNQPITVRLSVRDGSASGTVVYTETRNITTNAFGLFYYGIGSPGATSVIGTLGTVNWATGNKFLQVEIDPKGGTLFADAGTTQLLSVPYAIYAAGAPPTGNAGGSLTGIYPNPTIANGAITLAMIAPGVLPTTLPPSGPAGGSLTGTYPNPTVANGAIIQSMIAAGVTLPPNGPAGGSLTGTYPNPTVANGAIFQPMIAAGVTLPPNGPAGGSLTGSYPNPVIANGAVTQAMLSPGITLPPSGPAGGDLSGNFPNPTVSKIQGRTVSSTAPVINNVLGFDGTNWGPVSLATQPDNYWRLTGTSIYNANTGNIGAGTNTPHASAKLDISSTSSGLLMPRMTMAQRDAITSPAISLMIYQTDNTPGYYYYNGSAWVQVATGSSAANNWTLNGTNIYNNNAGNVGIGTNTPARKFHVVGGDALFSDSVIAKRIRTGSEIVPIGLISRGYDYGIYAISPDYMAIYADGNVVGISGSGGTYGVQGFSANGRGVYGSSIGGYGVYASSSNIGIYSEGSVYGIYGSTPNGYGVSGNSGYIGVRGSGDTYGVGGFSDNGHGVHGTSEAGDAVYGYSVNGRGGYFRSFDGYGLWARTDRADRSWAGVFEGNVFTYNSYQTSDRNLKKDIKDVGDAMSIIKQLKPKIYEFRNDSKLSNLHLPKGKHYGVLAQDLEEVLPNLVMEVENEVSPPVNMGAISKPDLKEDKKEIPKPVPVEKAERITIKAVNYTELIPIMIKAMQEQQLTIQEQKDKITALEARLTRLESVLVTSTKK